MYPRLNKVTKKESRLPEPKFIQSIINILLQTLLVTTLKVMIMPPSIYVTSTLKDKEKNLEAVRQKIIGNSMLFLGLQRDEKTQFPQTQL